MSYKKLKTLVLGLMAVAALASGASSASAVTWTSNGSAAGTPFTATAGAGKLQINSSPVVSLVCTNTSLTGRLYGPGPNALTTKVADITLMCTGTTAGGLPDVTNCPTASLAAFVTGATVGGVTPISYRQSTSATFICQTTITSLPGCVITLTATGGAGAQAFTGSYSNATSQWTINSAGQTLTASWTAACTIFATRPGSATATYGSNATPPGNKVYTVTSAFKPLITAS